MAGLANVALIYTHTVCKLAAPAVSEYCSVKFWLARDPEFGVTETAAGTRRGPGYSPGAQLLPPAVGSRNIRGVHVDVLGSRIGRKERHRQIERQRIAVADHRCGRHIQ